MVDLATLAVLLARGCPDDALEDAHKWLAGRKIPDAMADTMAELDEAIRVARSMHD